MTARSMDWAEDMHSNIWVYPLGMHKDGGIDKNSIQWSSKYGSVTVSNCNAGTVDALNEKSLFANILYLVEADYGKSDKPTFSISAWAQYVVDNFATVKEVVEALTNEPFQIVAPILPNGKPAALHLSISDTSGDSAIFEHVNGKLEIHHSKEYKVMTNSPLFEQQLALNTYWKEIGGSVMLPGTSRAADRYVRTSYYMSNIPKYEGKKALASLFGIIRNVSVPLGIPDPKKPNIAPTRWRVVADQDPKAPEALLRIDPFAKCHLDRSHKDRL